MTKIKEEEIQQFSDIVHGIIKKSNFRKVEEQFKKLKELTTIEISIIDIVSRKPEVILGEIILELEVPKSTLTNAINRLEKRNYINRIISKRDRRSYGLELTGDGREAQKEHLEFEKAIYGSLLSGLDNEKDRKQLLELLVKIEKNAG